MQSPGFAVATTPEVASADQDEERGEKREGRQSDCIMHE